MKHLHSTVGPSVETEWRVYQDYLESVKGKIPPALADFALINSHDARILNILHPSKRTLSITLSGFAYEELKSLTFTVGEVIRDFAPDKLVGQALWGHEISMLDGDVFEIRAKVETSELFVHGKLFEITTEPSGFRQRRDGAPVPCRTSGARRA
jgi:hypothetical protein